MDDENAKWFCVDCGRRYAKIVAPDENGKAPCGCTLNLHRVGVPQDLETRELMNTILGRVLN